MNRSRLILASKSLGGAALFSTGAVGYALFAPVNIKEVKVSNWSGNFNDENKITEGVEKINTTSKMTRVHGHHEKSFFNKCHRDASSEENCHNYIVTKADGGHPIRLFQTKDQITNKMGGGNIYEFIYRKNPEDDEIEKYFGQCMPINTPNNPCEESNLPEGGIKSFVENIPVPTVVES